MKPYIIDRIFHIFRLDLFQTLRVHLLITGVLFKVSPADGRIINAGTVNSCNVEQIKGVTYTIKTFLGEPTWNKTTTMERDDHDFVKLVSSEDYLENEILPRTMSTKATFRDKASDDTSTTYFKYSNTDNMLRNLEHEGCDLLHLGFDNSYQCANKVGTYDTLSLGWLVLYFQFCIKDLLINSFQIGFQIMYGIKSSITLNNGRISKGASFLRSQFSFSSYLSTSPSTLDAEIKAKPTNMFINETDGIGDDDDDDDDNSHAKTSDDACDLEWQEYKSKLLHNPNNELYQFVVYLAPGDYHRFHSPADLKINFRRHFQGEFLS